MIVVHMHDVSKTSTKQHNNKSRQNKQKSDVHSLHKLRMYHKSTFSQDEWSYACQQQQAEYNLYNMLAEHMWSLCHAYLCLDSFHQCQKIALCKYWYHLRIALAKHMQDTCSTYKQKTMKRMI